MNTVSVQGSKIIGDVIGGNKYVKVLSAPNPDALKNAIVKLTGLSQDSDEYKDFVEGLDFYLNDVKSSRNVIGLEQKLINGGREDLVDEAVTKKDRFSKILARGQLSPRRQYMYYYALQKIQSSFDGNIRPLIKEKIKFSEIDSAIYNEVVVSVYAELVEVDISIDQYLIYGMLYFLTGKCHLRWEV